jgi:MFS transporter, DHA1 family, inner membrane transport protein
VVGETVSSDDGRAGEMAPMASSRLSVIPALMLATFATALNGMALGPFLPAIATDLGTSVALLGQIPALMVLLSAVLGLVIGPLADQIGHRRTLVGSLLVLAIGTLGIGLATSYGILLLVALAGAVGRAAAQPVALVIAGTRFEGDQQRRAVSWATTGISGAVVAGVPILTVVAGAFGWRAAIIFLALVTCVVAFVARRTLEADSPRSGALMSLRDILSAYQPLVAHRPTLGLIGGSLLGNAGVWAFLTYLGAFYVQQHGYTVQQVGWVYLVAGGAVVAGTLAVAGRLGTLPLRPLLIAGRLVNAATLGAALMLPLPALATVGLIMLQAGTNGMSVVAGALLLTRESPAGRATTMTLNSGANNVGTALGAALGGLMLAIASYPAIGLCAALLCCASAYLVWRSGQGIAIAPVAVTPP